MQTDVMHGEETSFLSFFCGELTLTQDIFFCLINIFVEMIYRKFAYCPVMYDIIIINVFIVIYWRWKAG